MYTLENLQQKNLKELKEIGQQMNVLPEGDRRLRRNWIDAIAGVVPPLLQLLETSPGVEVEPVQEAIEVQVQEPIESSPAAVECPSCGATHGLYTDRDYLDKPVIRCLHCHYCRIKHYPGPIVLEAEEPPIYKPETKDGIDLQDFTVQAQEPPIESKFGCIVYPRAQKPIAQTEITETISDVGRFGIASDDLHHSRLETAQLDGDSRSAKAERQRSQDGDRVLEVERNAQRDRGRALFHHSPELAAVLNDEQPPNRGEGKGRLESQSKVSQSAIGFCASPVTFSPKFLATYPPYFGEVLYKAEATGQLNLLEPKTDGEPPDFDDFADIDAFNEAMARWDAENPESLAASMDSMCEWAPCPHEWYEPEAENLPLKASSMMELSLSAIESSSTFSIPTFDAWCDRSNRHSDTDEPPDTGIGARLPGPKPPNFPPRAIGSDISEKCFNAKLGHNSDTTRTRLEHTTSRVIGYSKKCLIANRHTNPEELYCITYCMAAAGSSRQGRSPPGGDEII
ncbi:hypothetical protein [Microcoleus asticus]|uniref:LIM zinc-binding domain-containing protein n=1 Tax=Microcoleus asticus IPMA8 TaxID=2563858 RepID=A0ABX2DA92_9CYAN|nr:hypothetical protein [Microcoleus asticus]NQE38510.1 hypothetical protein [Microcoleus asticus IPMA8]